MSGLDVAVSVAGIASVGILVAKGLVQIADGIGNAGVEVRLCASDTALFSQLLEGLALALKTPTASSRTTQATTDDLIELSKQILRPFRNLVSRLIPLLVKYQESTDRLNQIGLRIQWYFRHKSKIAMYQQALIHLKATLACFLGSINLQEARASAPPKIFLSQMHVENSQTSLNQKIREGYVALLEPTSSALSDRRIELGREDLRTNANEPSSASKVEESDGQGTYQIVHRDEFDSDVMNTFENEIDDDVTQETTTAIRVDLLSLQRKILRLASNALNPTAASQTQESTDLPLDKINLSQSSNEKPKSTNISSNAKQVPSDLGPYDSAQNSVFVTDPNGKIWGLPHAKCTAIADLEKFRQPLERECQLREFLYEDKYEIHLDIPGPGTQVTLRKVDRVKTDAGQQTAVESTEKRKVIYPTYDVTRSSVNSFIKFERFVIDDILPRRPYFKSYVNGDSKAGYHLKPHSVYRNDNIILSSMWNLIGYRDRLTVVFNDHALNQPIITMIVAS